MKGDSLISFKLSPQHLSYLHGEIGEKIFDMSSRMIMKYLKEEIEKSGFRYIQIGIGGPFEFLEEDRDFICDTGNFEPTLLMTKNPTMTIGFGGGLSFEEGCKRHFENFGKKIRNKEVVFSEKKEFLDKIKRWERVIGTNFGGADLVYLLYKREGTKKIDLTYSIEEFGNSTNRSCTKRYRAEVPIAKDLHLLFVEIKRHSKFMKFKESQKQLMKICQNEKDIDYYVVIIDYDFKFGNEINAIIRRAASGSLK